MSEEKVDIAAALAWARGIVHLTDGMPPGARNGALANAARALLALASPAGDVQPATALPSVWVGDTRPDPATLAAFLAMASDVAEATDAVRMARLGGVAPLDPGEAIYRAAVICRAVPALLAERDALREELRDERMRLGADLDAARAQIGTLEEVQRKLDRDLATAAEDRDALAARLAAYEAPCGLEEIEARAERGSTECAEGSDAMRVITEDVPALLRRVRVAEASAAWLKVERDAAREEQARVNGKSMQSEIARANAERERDEQRARAAAAEEEARRLRALAEAERSLRLAEEEHWRAVDKDTAAEQDLDENPCAATKAAYAAAFERRKRAQADLETKTAALTALRSATSGEGSGS